MDLCFICSIGSVFITHQWMLSFLLALFEKQNKNKLVTPLLCATNMETQISKNYYLYWDLSV